MERKIDKVLDLQRMILGYQRTRDSRIDELQKSLSQIEQSLTGTVKTQDTSSQPSASEFIQSNDESERVRKVDITDLLVSKIWKSIISTLIIIVCWNLMKSMRELVLTISVGLQV